MRVRIQDPEALIPLQIRKAVEQEVLLALSRFSNEIEKVTVTASELEQADGTTLKQLTAEAVTHRAGVVTKSHQSTDFRTSLGPLALWLARAVGRAIAAHERITRRDTLRYA